MKMRPLRVMRGIIITWCPFLLIVCKLLHFNLFPKTTGPIVLKHGRSVHLIVLKKFLVHQGLRLKRAFPITLCLSSVIFSDFDILKNHKVKLDQTLMWYSLNAPLPKVCPLTLPSIKDGCHVFRLVKKIGNLWKSSSELRDGLKPNLVKMQELLIL
jgi:hypothetical protein